MLLIVAITGFSLSLALFYHFVPKSSIGSGTAIIIENISPTPEQEQTSSGLPVHLSIPKINVDASFEYVGLTSNREMGTPRNPNNVAWFELGPHPGDNGSAVIAGHYGIWKDGERSVFDDLYKLRKGDLIYVENDKGLTIPFIVRENRRYDPKEDSSNVFNSNDGQSHLNLITCEGAWDEHTQQYSERLVVFADRL